MLPTTKPLRTKELAEVLGCSEQTVRNYAERGMPVLKVDDLGRWYDPSVCVAWVNANPHSGSGGRRTGAGRKKPSTPEGEQMRMRIDDAHTAEMVHQQIQEGIVPPGAERMSDLLNHTHEQLEALVRVYPTGHARLNKAQVDLINGLLEAQRRSMAIAVEAGQLVESEHARKAVAEMLTPVRRGLDELAARISQGVVEALEHAGLLTEQAQRGNAAQGVVRAAIDQQVISVQQRVVEEVSL